MVKNPFKRAKKKEVPPILVMAVGDDSAVLSFLSTTLQAGGYAVHSATSVPAAVSLLDEIDMPNVFIGDFQNPETVGTEFMAKLGMRFGKSALPPVLFLMDTPEDEAVAGAVGVYDVLPKPFEAESLLKCVKSIVERHKDESANA